MLLATIARYSQLFQHIVVVIPTGNHAMKILLKNQSVDIVECEQSVQGMGRSIACGITQLSATDAVLIALGDMPIIEIRTIEKLHEALSANHIIAPTHNGVRGNPVGFGREYFAELLQLQGDRGGRGVIDNNSNDFIELPVNDKGVLFDIDTPKHLLMAGQHTG